MSRIESSTLTSSQSAWTPHGKKTTGLEPFLLRVQTPEFLAGLGNSRERFQQELKELSREEGIHTLSHGLFLLGTRLQEAERYASAAEIYQHLSESSVVPAEVRQQAEGQIKALQGSGSAGDRIGFLLPRLAKDALSLETIAGIAGAGLVGRAAYAGLFSRFAGNAAWRTAWGISGAKAMARTGGLLVEAPTFTLLSHGARNLLNSGSSEPVSWSNEIVSAMLFLGVLRGTHAAASRWLPGRTLFSSAAAFTGIAASNRILQAWELKPRTNTDSLLADSFASLLHFAVVERSVNGLLGPGYARFLRETEFRASFQGPTRSGNSSGLELNHSLAWEGIRGKIPNRPFDFNSPQILQMASLKGKTESPAKRSTRGISRPSRSENRRERELLAQLQSRMASATKLSELPSAKQVNEIKNPNLHRVGWVSRIDHLLRLKGEGTARLAIQRGFQAKPGRNVERDRRMLLTHLETTLNAQTAVPTLTSSPETSESPPLLPPAAPENLSVLLDHLKEKSRHAGIWKFPELLATKLVKKIEAMGNPRIREEAASLFQAVISRVQQGSLESPACVRLLICFELALENKLEFHPAQWFLEPTSDSPLLGSPSLGISPDPLPGKVILRRGQEGMVDYIRRYNLLTDWLTDSEIIELIQREGPSHADSLPGLRARQFREGILQDNPHSVLAKNWNTGVGTVSSLLTERRKQFHIHLTKFIEETLIEKMKKN